MPTEAIINISEDALDAIMELFGGVPGIDVELDGEDFKALYLEHHEAEKEDDHADVLEFIKDFSRLCSSGDCAGCPLDKKYELNTSEAETVYNTVQNWKKEHPKKTYLSDFLEKFPNAGMDSDGMPKACRKNLHGDRMEKCPDCVACWTEEMED